MLCSPEHPRYTWRVLVQDWLSEMTMTMHGTGNIKNTEQLLIVRSFVEELNHTMFAKNFRDCFEPGIAFASGQHALRSTCCIVSLDLRNIEWIPSLFTPLIK
jgi:hypothetical protein